MSTAKKLPSGSWRTRIFIGTDADGHKRYKSFTCSDPGPAGKRKCERAASEYLDSQNARVENITFGKALDKYISDREGVCSPRTIMDYRSSQKLYLSSLENVKVADITQPMIQELIGKLSRSGGRHGTPLSAKTISNIHCLIVSVLKVYRPEFALNTCLPKRNKANLYIPSDEEIQQLLELLQGHSLEIPVLLACFGPMRRGEIAALRTENINGNVIHVCENMVRNADMTWVIKAPKSIESDRYIPFPDFVIEKMRGINGRITNLTPNEITDGFHDFLADNKMHSFRFHDLRHWCASTLHAKGVPDAYIMRRGGWSNDRVLKEVYRHALEWENLRQNEIINNVFSKMYATNMPRK